MAEVVPHMRHRSTGECEAGIVALSSFGSRGAGALGRDGRASRSSRLRACIFRPVALISLAEWMSLQVMLTNEGSDRQRLWIVLRENRSR
eukprot:2345014-Rhodomonas_salina.1